MTYLEKEDLLYLEVCKAEPDVEKIKMRINKKNVLQMFDINAHVVGGDTLLERAAAHNKTPDAVKVLIEKGASPGIQTKGGWTALHSAVNNKYGSLKMVRILLEAMTPKDINAQAQGGWTALDQAVGQQKSSAMIKVLVDAGAKTNIKPMPEKT